LLRQRREIRNNPLAIMNMSCSSYGTVDTWMAAYRQSLKDANGNVVADLKSLHDVPVVIGAKRGFETGGALDILEDMQYATSTIDAVAKGRPANDVVNLLKKPNAIRRVRNVADTATYLWAKVRGCADPRGGPPTGDEAEALGFAGFAPCCNVDPQAQDLYNLSGALTF
jgi:hypothetical protein